MPEIKPRHLKAISTLDAEPDKLNNRHHIIALLDLSGRSGNDIAEMVEMTPARVSLIRNSSLYQALLVQKREELQSQFIEKKSTALANDPVETFIRDHCLEAAEKKLALMREAQSEFVQLSAANSMLDRGGYKSKFDRTKVSVEITEKMANRFERILAEPPDRVVTITRIMDT